MCKSIYLTLTILHVMVVAAGALYSEDSTVSRQKRMMEESLLDQEQEGVTVQPLAEDVTEADLLPPESVTSVLAVLVPQEIVTRSKGTMRHFDDKPVWLKKPTENIVVYLVLIMTVPTFFLGYFAKEIFNYIYTSFIQCSRPAEQPPQAPPNLDDIELVVQAP